MTAYIKSKHPGVMRRFTHYGVPTHRTETDVLYTARRGYDVLIDSGRIVTDNFGELYATEPKITVVHHIRKDGTIVGVSYTDLRRASCDFEFIG